MEYKTAGLPQSQAEDSLAYSILATDKSLEWEGIKKTRFFQEYFRNSRIDSPYLPSFNEMFSSMFPRFVLEQFEKFINDEMKCNTYFNMYFKRKEPILDFILGSLCTLTTYSDHIPTYLYSNELIRALFFLLRRNKKQYRDEIFRILLNLAKNSFASFKALMDNDILNFVIDFMRNCDDEILISNSIYFLSWLCSFNVGDEWLNILFNLFVEYKKYNITLYGFSKISKWCPSLINSNIIMHVFNSISEECTQFNNCCFICLYNCCIFQNELLHHLLDLGLITKIDYCIKKAKDLEIIIDFLILIASNTRAYDEYINSILQYLMNLCENQYKLKIGFLKFVSVLLKNGGYQIINSIKDIGVISHLCESIDSSNIQNTKLILESLINYFKIVGTDNEEFQFFKEVIISLQNEVELNDQVNRIITLFNIDE